VLCCSGVIQRVLHAGGRASIVWLTTRTGGARLLVVEKSLFSALEAALTSPSQNAGVRRQPPFSACGGSAVFSGYPDRGILPLLLILHNTLSLEYLQRQHRPYPARCLPDAPTRAKPRARISICARRLIDADPGSGRATLTGHRATGLVTIRAMARRNDFQGSYWIVHGGEFWPIPRG